MDELNDARREAWEARLAALDAYNDAAGRTADDALAAAWAAYLIACAAYYKADGAYWGTYLEAALRPTLNSAWDTEEDLDKEQKQ